MKPKIQEYIYVVWDKINETIWFKRECASSSYRSSWSSLAGVKHALLYALEFQIIKSYQIIKINVFDQTQEIVEEK